MTSRVFSGSWTTSAGGWKSRGTTRTGQARIGELEQIQKDLSWTDLDLEPTTRRLATLTDALDRVDTPEQQVRRDAYKLARQQVTGAEGAATKCQDRVQHLNLLRGAVQRAQDSANDVIDAHDPLTADEQAAAASLPFAAPALERVDLTGRDVDAKTDAAVQASYHEAARVLEDQIAAHDATRATHERTLLVIIQAYRNINDRTHREVDDTIESLPTLEHIHQQLVTDDLPRTRKNWLAKVDADLNQGLRTLLRQIDVDRKEITRGLSPINAVLAGVPSRNGSHLAIEPVDHLSSNLQEFRKVVLTFTRDNPLGEDLFNTETKVEASFRKLRKSLERLTDSSRSGESWRRSVFDACEHVTFRAIETPGSGKPIVHEGVSGMSGGEGQELIAFILGAALRYRLGEGGQTPPTYGCVVLNEGFVKDDTDYTGRALRALQELGFQLIVGAPREKATAFEDFRRPSRLHQHRPGQPRWRADLFDDHSGGPSVRPGRGVMRGPEYVLGKAQNRYRSVWRDALLGTDSGAYTVALEPPSSAAITTHASDVSAWLIRWREWAVQHPEVSACAPAPSAPSSAPSPSTPTSTSQTFPPWRASTRTPPGTGSGPAPGGISSATTRPGRRCGPGRHASSISTVTTSPPCSPPLPGSGPIRAPG